MFYTILPKTDHRKSGVDPMYFNVFSLFFFAGPILGAGDWHPHMGSFIASRVRDALIVNPSRYEDKDHPHRKAALPAPNGNFRWQTLWERFYMELAAWSHPRGCIVFWLGRESQTHPRMDGNPYAMDTRGEIGRWSVHRLYRPRTRFIIGIEPGFPGENQIVTNVRGDLGLDFPVYRTMEETAVAAIAESERI